MGLSKGPWREIRDSTMELTGKQKAALLLTSLDSVTATQLLKGLATEDIQEIAMELAQIDVAGAHGAAKQAEVAKEFCRSLKHRQGQGLTIKGFLNEMLANIVGKEAAEEIQSEVKGLTQKKDPFIDIRSANTDELVLALEGQHIQTVAMVLSELSPKKSQDVLSLLHEDVQAEAVRKMTRLEMVSSRVRRRIASTVYERLKTFKGETLPEGREQTLRKLAIVLSGLRRDLRDRLLAEIKEHDEETASMVRNLMVTWEDIRSIADRSMQEFIRSVESNTLALALHGAEEALAQKIRSNLSERAAASLDEEISLMAEPSEQEVLDAREEVVRPFREANEKGELRFTVR